MSKEYCKKCNLSYYTELGWHSCTLVQVSREAAASPEMQRLLRVARKREQTRVECEQKYGKLDD